MQQPSYSHGITTVPLLGDTIGENLRRTVEKFGKREALVSCHQNYRATYREFWDQTSVIGRALMARGVKKGDRVGLWSPNRFEWAVTQYATSRIGAIMVNINPAYRSHELEHVLKQSGCALLILARGFRQTDYVSMFRDVEGRLPEHIKAIVIDDEWGDLKEDAKHVSEEELHLREQTLDPDDAIDIQYTSGTTGFPKGATLSHHNILNNGFFIGELCRYTAADRVCIPVPFYHCFGMVLGNLACTRHGACIVIPAPSFEPAVTLAAVQLEKCTALYGVPTMFIAELAMPDFGSYDLSTLRTGIMAGSPCPVEVMKRVVSEMHMSEVTICYGMTETSPVAAQTRADDELVRRVSTVGQVHPHIEVKVTDPATGLVLPRGDTGELCTRGYSVMLGYWNEPEKTAEVIDAGRWMHTGDLAVIDEAGYLNIVGRIKDLVIRGGENVYPREVEEFLYTHPDIEDVQVIGVPDAKFGEELCAWIKLRPASELTSDDVRAFCTGKIAHYKIPRYVRFTAEFPMTITGKVQKFKMREVSVTELDLHAASRITTA